MDPFTTRWQEMVAAHVHDGSMEGIKTHISDYPGFLADPKYRVALQFLANTTYGPDRNSTLASFINAYNALAINMILTHPCKYDLFTKKCLGPIKSIQEIGNILAPVWKMNAGVFGGKNYSLDDVENYLKDPKPWQEDPRIHAAIVCASISCPNVRLEAFVPERLDEQLADQMRDFLRNTDKGLKLDQSSNTLTLSPIFNWNAADFLKFAPTVLAYLLPYVPADVAAYLSTHPTVTIKYFTYNWNVNGPPTCKCP